MMSRSRGRPSVPVAWRFHGMYQRGADHECWEWTAGRFTSGYGAVWDSKTRRAHRVSWELSHGCSVPPGKVVMHLCDNKPCVNPSHLKVGSQAQNTKNFHETRKIRNSQSY